MKLSDVFSTNSLSDYAAKEKRTIVSILLTKTVHLNTAKTSVTLTAESSVYAWAGKSPCGVDVS